MAEPTKWVLRISTVYQDVPLYTLEEGAHGVTGLILRLATY